MRIERWQTRERVSLGDEGLQKRKPTTTLSLSLRRSFPSTEQLDPATSREKLLTSSVRKISLVLGLDLNRKIEELFGESELSVDFFLRDSERGDVEEAGEARDEAKINSARAQVSG